MRLQLAFHGQWEEVKAGTECLADDLNVELSEGGMPVRVVRQADPGLRVTLRDGEAGIAYGRTIHFFRGFGLLVEALRRGQREADIRETPRFDTIGPMFDVSQSNAVMKTDTVRRFIRMQALMGMNMIMLYTEDSYDVPERPYFGYMRGRYSEEEIRRLDDYAAQFGIEMIPCIQTLSHLEDVLKWQAFEDVRDDHETMLVGEEETYRFVEQMIAAASRPVRSKRIHIGMDEAWNLGLGRYLRRHGYRTKFELMNEHLRRVLDITRKLGLRPMMWSDMYFRAGSSSGSYYDPECVIPDAVIEGMPKDIQFVYWDYYHYDESFYADWIRRHKAFGSIPVFAGGIWNWKGFVLHHGSTFAATNAAMAACKREGVREVIATLWGDDGTECDWFASLLGLQLFAEHAYADDPTEERIRERFRLCTGCSYDDFMAIDLVDEIPGVPQGNPSNDNPSRCLLWQNVLMGLFDRTVEGRPVAAHYEALAPRMKEASGRNGEFGPVFELLGRLCDVLAVKAELGLQLADAYARRDTGQLADLLGRILPELKAKVANLRELHRARWMALNKPFGWEVLDFRYGGLLMGLDTAAVRLGDYLEGRAERLEELEEPRLPFNGKEGGPDCYWYKFIPSANRLVQWQP